MIESKYRTHMDYRELLKKYINYVSEQGTTFISRLEYADEDFTPEEKDELRKLEAETIEENTGRSEQNG